VDWYPWGEEAFARAKKENKPVIISIGYASCHWCHVMEKESFEDDSVAAFMNEHFISIKVDREERPDIDQIYIEVAQMINGSAGWPLNSIVLPDAKPFFAGTYYPKNQWLELLSKVIDLWENDRAVIQNQATQITNGIKSSPLYEEANSSDFSSEQLELSIDNWLQMFDKKEGGLNRAPKFPMPTNLEALLLLSKVHNNKEAHEIVNLTLTKMAAGGIYDQVGGGFARYSTDGYWKVPHFEKMLYDNGQLLSVYAKAYQLTKDPLYEQIVSETIAYLQREMRSASGGYYSSLDADSEGEEGLFYIWEAEEIDEALQDKANIVKEYYQVTDKGNWEHGHNILLVDKNLDKLAKKHELSVDSLQHLIMSVKSQLLQKRTEKTRPALDDKIITSWNALTIIGLANAYRAFQNDQYLSMAVDGGNFIVDHLMKEDDRLDRIFKNGESSINAFLDDYAFTISAFIMLYQATFDIVWLSKAKLLTDYVLEHFDDPSTGYFFYTSDIDQPLIARKVDNIDNVIPSANSEMARNLFILGKYFYNQSYLERSDKMLLGMSNFMQQHTASFVNWFHLYLLKSGEFYEVAIVGDNYGELKSKMEQSFLPNVILLGGDIESELELLQNKLIKDETWVYVCKDKMCKLPVDNVASALAQMD